MTDNSKRFIFSGGPGAGKTTVLTTLHRRGYFCIEESARPIIQARLAAGLSPRPAPAVFARQILRADINQYQRTADHQVAVYDRSIVDALGMMRQARSITQAQIDTCLRQYPYHKTVFLFPPWQQIYRTDDERDQSFEQAIAIFNQLHAWYEECGYQCLLVPIGTRAARAQFVSTYITSTLG